MTPPITVRISHQLGLVEARRRIQAGFSSIQQGKMPGLAGMMFSIQERWEGDCLHFEAGGLGQKLSGRLLVMPDAIQIQVDVPALLATFAERFMGALKTGTQKLLQP